MQSTQTAYPPLEESTRIDAHATLDGLVREMGSSLEVDTVALRAQRTLRRVLGSGRIGFYVLDGTTHRAQRRGSEDGQDGLPARWVVSGELESELRSQSPLCEFRTGELPDELAEFTHALRLVDGDVVVGFVVFEHFPTGELDPSRKRLLQTMGRMIGASVSRALVHQTLVEVTSRLDGAQRLQQHILDHVSHEFNTPLMILRSASEFAQSSSDEERGLFFDMHSQALDRLEELVRGILEVARSRAQLQLQQIEGADLVRALVDPLLEVQPWPTEKLRRWTRVSSSASLTVDPDALSFAIEHVLRNAWQFGGDQGGLVGVAVYPHSLRHWRAAESEGRISSYLGALEDSSSRSPLPPPPAGAPDILVIEVADNGIGIPSDELEHVFEPFTQARNSPLKTVSGAGMGLPTCRKRVEDMGGEVLLASREGRGTVVSLVLPLVESA